MNIAANAVVTGRRKRKHSLLPLLVVLFLISYGLLTNLVLQQDKTIDSQRTLVHLLLKDSLQLSAMRKAERQKGQADPGRRASMNSLQAQAHAPKIPVIHVPSQAQKSPSAQVRSEQVQSEKVPSGKQNGAKTDRKTGKAQKRVPNRPPAELTDPSDTRRVSVAI